MALAAGLGGAVGVAGFAGATRLMMPERAARSAPAVRTELSEEMKSLREAIAQVRIGLRHLGDSIATLRTSLEASGKANGAQFAKVNDAIARLNDGIERTERSQAEPTARLAKVIETLERLERRAAAMAAAPEPTGSILGQPPRTLQQQAQQLQQAQPQASLQSQPIAAPQPQQPSPAAFEARTAQPPVIEDWALRRVVNGIAILESRYGLAEVEVGDTIRGIGRVQEIKRQDGRWVVVTARGLIVPTR